MPSTSPDPWRRWPTGSRSAATIQPLSSLFDQATHVVLDVVCLELAGRRGVDNAAARTAHANTE